jgi:hypothetical protein
MNVKSLLLGFGMSFAFISTTQGSSIQSNLSVFVAQDCEPVVEDYLDRKNINRSEIKSVEYITNYISAGEFGEEKDFEGWVSFKGCTGNLVIKMDRACYIRTDYVTSQCRSTGVPKN